MSHYRLLIKKPYIYRYNQSHFLRQTLYKRIEWTFFLNEINLNGNLINGEDPFITKGLLIEKHSNSNNTSSSGDSNSGKWGHKSSPNQISETNLKTVNKKAYTQNYI